MSELLGHTPQYTCVDEWEPPVHDWSFDSGWMNFDDYITGALIMLSLLFGPGVVSLQFESYLNEKFWYRVDIQNRISHNAKIYEEVGPKNPPLYIRRGGGK